VGKAETASRSPEVGRLLPKSAPPPATPSSAGTAIPPKVEEEFRIEPVRDELEGKMKVRSRSFLSIRNDNIRLPFSTPKQEMPQDMTHVPVHLQGLLADDDGVRVFGLRYEVIMARAQEIGSVPRFLVRMTEYLDSSGALKAEGIFRLCGAQTNIVSMINQIDSGRSLKVLVQRTHGLCRRSP
jgi:hypothetical protein